MITDKLDRNAAAEREMLQFGDISVARPSRTEPIPGKAQHYRR
jgi:hypothetical protein